ncbi:hypothetical protein K493DRAFT_336516 [Basidiobolus meristosporus CBS 931.73]|uniref:Putative gamma-glutamylcyclotransferase n=1 Tax=Basidiobolus meristosporus CBS 931.73 TaxID=1314790 RepID=A0A1Y1YHT5_9FUNG|nr:hypothetical protein K493DRAFT_336516 [Basidiobolus meristosporus CBS 931.73]|eukprot:ORX97535.1 hypothetical protein K493DRAFT_336516 [Basidiobolus meristosporus CBS 931.73]
MSSLFVYGTLMSPEVISRVIATLQCSTGLSRLTFRPASLKVLGAQYPAIVQSKLDSVEGIVVSGLSQEDIALLDLYEGEQYRRVSVQVETAVKYGSELLGTPDVPSEHLAVETYVWAHGLQGLSHLDWNFQDFVNESLKKWLTNEEEFRQVDVYHTEK